MIEQLAMLGIGVAGLCIFFVVVWALTAIFDWLASLHNSRAFKRRTVLLAPHCRICGAKPGERCDSGLHS